MHQLRPQVRASVTTQQLFNQVTNFCEILYEHHSTEGRNLTLFLIPYHWLASHRGGPGSSPGFVAQVFSEYFGFPCQSSLH
jgi:hypothetical protein